jgi:putative SOS response-associated peptidase YedK
MCFFNSQNKKALAIAKRFGRKTDIVEIAQEILDETTSPPTPLQKRGGHEVLKAFLNPDCLIVTRNVQLLTAKWGLIPFWVRDLEKVQSIRNMTAIARAETAFTQPSFRTAIRQRRCLIPSTGFYEYHHEGKEAIPYRIFLRDADVFSLAGVFDEWRHPGTKETIRTFAVLTVPANELCGEIHNGGRYPGRMPAILTEQEEERWLLPELTEKEIGELLKPYHAGAMDACRLDRDYLRRA